MRIIKRVTKENMFLQGEYFIKVFLTNLSRKKAMLLTIYQKKRPDESIFKDAALYLNTLPNIQNYIQKGGKNMTQVILNIDKWQNGKIKLNFKKKKKRKKQKTMIGLANIR
jgi:hypothetical protein